MRLKALLATLLLLGAVAPAEAATIVVFTNAESLAKRTVVLDTPGPDRLVMCMAPPATAGCTEVPIRRVRTRAT